MFMLIVELCFFYILFVFTSIIPGKYAKLRNVVYAHEVKDLVSMISDLRAVSRWRRGDNTPLDFGNHCCRDHYVSENRFKRITEMYAIAEFRSIISNIVHDLKKIRCSKSYLPSTVHYLKSVASDIRQIKIHSVKGVVNEKNPMGFIC